MSFKRTIKRFAHNSGFTCVTYSEDGEALITSGSTDGDIRIWQEISDDDPASFCVGESAICCAQYTEGKKARVIASTENNTIQCFTFPEGERDGVMLRFAAPVTSIKINKKWIAAGSEDFTIKVQKRETTDEYIELKGHDGPILHVDLSVKNQLASSSGDGTIRVWNLDNSNVIKTIEGFEKVNEFNAAKVYSTPSYDPKGNFLAYPKDAFIYILDTLNWETKHKINNDDVTGNYSVCGFSFCGKYIAAGSLNGEISVWNVADRSRLKGPTQDDDNHSIVSIAWNPSNNGEFAFCDSDGQMSSIVTSLSKSSSSKSNAFIADEAEVDGDEPEEDIDDLYGGMEVEEDDEDADNENCVSLEKLKSQTLKTSADSEDEDAGTVKSLPMSERLPVAKPFQLQPAFQPGSTPLDLEHRFMMWNHVGQVMSHSGDENSIIAEFHDVNVHPSLHILNNLNHEMASLSTTCLALATKESPCRLVCIAFVSAGSREWSTTMPDCEEIQAIAAGESFVAAATDAGVIRFFTTQGTQREVIAVPGQVVALSAMENKLVIAYHTSNTCNRFSLMVITLIGVSMTNRVVDLPTVKDSKLTWLGFSDTGSIIASDSTSRVISYNIRRNLWYPICDLSSHVVGASDNYFIISVSEKSQKIRATLCRGLGYPLTNPRPIVREIDYALPMCYTETEKSKLEEALVRAANFTTESSEKSIIEKGLKLFSTAMNAELEARAYEIIELIGDKKLIESAAKYASQKGRIHMSNKISKLLVDYEEKEKQKEALIREIEQDVELFSETYEMETPAAIGKRVQETSTPIIVPKPMITQKRVNPFAKRGDGSKMLNSTPTNTLSHLTKKSIGYNDSATHSDDENTPNNNVTSKSERSISMSMDTPRPGNFGTWFIANRDDLRKNHATATDSELMKIGKELYKELTQKQKQPEEINSSSDLSQNSSMMNKRKLNLSGEDREKNASKLAKYGFAQD